MNQTSASSIKYRWLWLLLIIIGVTAAATHHQWRPLLNSVVARPTGRNEQPASDAKSEEAHAHSGYDHAHVHDDANSLELSQQARQNLGLNAETVRAVELQPFRRTITVPAVIAERPGRTLIKVATPLTGVVQHVHAVTGEAIVPDTVLFEIRLTHEDLVQTQSDFLQLLGELDVETREIKRLQAISDAGAIAGKTLLERQYARDKLEAQLAAKREALKLHGLSDRQVREIEETRHLLRELQIVAPSPDEHGEHEELRLTEDEKSRVVFFSAPLAGEGGQRPDEGTSVASKNLSIELAPSPRPTPTRGKGKFEGGLHDSTREVWFDAPDSKHPPGNSTAPLLIEQLFAHKGQSVAAGEPLCTLADYSRLYIEGQAFEQDASAISRTAQYSWPLTAIFDDGQERREITGLKLSFVANSVDPDSRTLSFFVDLPNEIIRDEKNAENQRFITWKYRIGQRLQLLVPVEEWPSVLVVPVDAVASEGAESYVFEKNGSHFDRVPVHVKYRDQQHVVIANDGSVKPGTVLALRSAHQMLMALKNKSGGGVDPHAGHNH